MKLFNTKLIIMGIVSICLCSLNTNSVSAKSLSEIENKYNNVGKMVTNEISNFLISKNKKMFNR